MMEITFRLVAVTAIVGVCAEFLVSAIEEVTKIWNISETFVGNMSFFLQDLSLYRN